MRRCHNLCPLAPLLTLLIGTVAFADAVRLNGFWIENVHIRSVGEGVMIYTTANGGEVIKPIDEVEDFRLQRHPELEQAADATEAGDHTRAAELLRQAQQRARHDWIRHYATQLLIAACIQADDPLHAARHYANLLLDDPDPHFIPQPPVDAVAAASDDDRRRIASLLQTALRRAPANQRPPLQTLLQAASPDAPEAPGPAQRQPESPKPAGDDRADSAVTLPRDVTHAARQDPLIEPVVDLLRRGEFEQAVQAATKAAQASGRLSDKLYLLGMAQLGVAEQTREPADYKDAGLSFMRVVVHFPRSGAVGPAALEAGYIHEKIGRPDLARRLYDRARLLLDEETDPAYYHRYLELAQ